MAKRPSRNPNQPADDGAQSEGAAFAWEFSNDDLAGQSPTGLPRNARPNGKGSDGVPDATRHTNHTPASGRSGVERRMPNPSRPVATGVAPAQANFIRDQLDRALDRWWAAGELPPVALLRDALLLLEAGGTLAESQRTLLLRAAIAHQRGLQTALRHQGDPERVALVLAEALIEWATPLEPVRMHEILRHDTRLKPLLIAELERSQVLLAGVPRQRAETALLELGRTPPNTLENAPPHLWSMPAPLAAKHRRGVRQVILVLLLMALVGFAWWQQRERTPPGMVAMPEATYAILGDGDRGTEGVTLAAFLIDRDEVTNRAYRRCINAGVCAWPVATSSMTRPDYFTNPAFDEYPVVHVTHAMAATYCDWQGKRLPSEAEWQAAASVSPTTGQAFRFPWGEVFDAQRANGGSDAAADTLAVGSFRPGGDSPSGLTDMAGNVAEWTATIVPDGTGQEYAVVKGGSFASAQEMLLVGARMLVEPDHASAEVGFRCARARLHSPA